MRTAFLGFTLAVLVLLTSLNGCDCSYDGLVPQMVAPTYVHEVLVGVIAPVTVTIGDRAMHQFSTSSLPLRTTIPTIFSTRSEDRTGSTISRTSTTTSFPSVTLTITRTLTTALYDISSEVRTSETTFAYLSSISSIFTYGTLVLGPQTIILVSTDISVFTTALSIETHVNTVADTTFVSTLITTITTEILRRSSSTSVRSTVRTTISSQTSTTTTSTSSTSSIVSTTATSETTTPMTTTSTVIIYPRTPCVHPKFRLPVGFTECNPGPLIILPSCPPPMTIYREKAVFENGDTLLFTVATINDLKWAYSVRLSTISAQTVFLSQPNIASLSFSSLHLASFISFLLFMPLF